MLTYSHGLLKLIHIDINGSYSHKICGKSYFVTFIDDFSRYRHVYLINHEFKAFDKFKIFKIEVKKQLRKSLKLLGLTKGDEYYGKHRDLG